MLINPRKAERRPWEMFFVGAFYALLSMLLVHWIFSGDAVLSKYSSIITITFTVMFSIPFMYYIIKYEESKDLKSRGIFKMLLNHKRALYAFMWLFFGFVVAFSIGYALFSSEYNFKAQVETFCNINRPTSFQDCVNEYGKSKVITSDAISAKSRILMIFSNNIYVLMFTILFSLIFGAGVIFILAWNASVIAAAIGIFAKSELSNLPLGIARYILHGLPEIASYFTGALAGGIISIAIIKKDVYRDKFWDIAQDALNLVIIAVILLFIAAIIEVYVTPLFF